MLLLLSVWPKDTPKNSMVQRGCLASSYTPSTLHSAGENRLGLALKGQSKILEDRRTEPPFIVMTIIKIMVRAMQTTKLQVFFPLWLFAAQIALETEWNVQWYCGCLVVGMATYILMCLVSPINLNEPSPKPPLVFRVESKPQNTSAMFVASDQL